MNPETFTQPANPDPDPDPQPAQQTIQQPKSSKIPMQIFTLALAAAVFVSAGLTYAWRQKEISSLNAEVKSLSTELEDLQRPKDLSQEEVFSTYTGIQQKARDTERSTDIISIRAKLEAYYAENGHYPSLANVNSEQWRSENLRGLDNQALIDPQSPNDLAKLVSVPAVQAYSYEVTSDANTSCESDATLCTNYTLTATLETELKGSKFVIKKSLN